MPELPEVETVCRILRKNVLNRQITGFNIYFNKVIKHPDIKTFKDQIVGQRINDIQRRGKNILFILDDYVLISHLRMEGKYYYMPITEQEDSKHNLVIFHLDNNHVLCYHDTRRFGTMHLYLKNQYLDIEPLNKLGVEPFSKDFTANYLYEKWNKKNQPIKTTLLEQNVVVGIGNIYANEILYMSHINPYQRTKDLTIDNYKEIVNNTKEVLNRAINAGGTTISTYHPAKGVDGKFVDKLFVHGRNKKECYGCKGIIVKEFINGRGTYYCPKCQVLK